MEFDLDLEDLDLKSVDMSSTSQNKNISFQNNNNNTNSQSAFKPTFREQSPNLTISTSNNDSMPSMNGFNSDKEVDFGLNLLVNKKKQRPESEITKLGSSGNSYGSNSGNPSPTNKMSSSFSSMFGNGNSNSNNNSSSNSMPQKVNFDDTEVLQSSLFDDNMTNIDLDKELNSMDLDDISPPKPSMSGPSLPNFGSSNGGSGFGGLGNNSGFAASATSTFGGSSMGGGNSYGSINTAGISSTENLSFEEIQKRKFDLLCKFERLRDKGIKLPKTFSMSSNYEEMNHEYERLIHHRKMDNSVKMQRRMLVSFASMAEFVNNKTGNPFDIHLDGWSENMNEEINNYDEVFEDLYEKYKESASMAPELKLVFMVASSAFWFHISNNMSKSVMGNMNMGDMFKNNPNLMNQFKEAAMGSMQQNSPGLANFMSMGQGGGSNSNSNSSGPPKYNPMAGPPFSNPRDAPPRGSTNINSSDDIDALIDSISN
jgi:hypothetical protein